MLAHAGEPGDDPPYWVPTAPHHRDSGRLLPATGPLLLHTLTFLIGHPEDVEALFNRTSPGGYFHGMVAKANAGELHLERKVWAMRRAAEPERYQRAGRGPRSP